MIALVALAGATLWGQKPSPRLTPATALVPAEPIWSIALDAVPVAGGAIDPERVYVPLRTERIIALSRLDGHQVWSRDIESSTPPVAGGGAVYVLASDEVHALDAATGEQRWRVPFNHHVDLPLALVGDHLFGVVEPATLVAMSVVDGAIAWERPLPSAPARRVVGDDRRLYAALADGSVTALSASDGAILWQRMLVGALAPPALAGDRLVVGSDANEVFALDASSGAVAWRWRVGGDVIGAASTGSMVFVAALDNLIRALDRSGGNQRWKKPISSRPAHPPQVFGDLIVVTSAAPTISVYNALTGTLVGTYVAPAELEGPALVAPSTGSSGAVMVVVTRDGRALGLRPTPPAPPPAGAPAGRGATPSPPVP